MASLFDVPELAKKLTHAVTVATDRGTIIRGAVMGVGLALVFVSVYVIVRPAVTKAAGQIAAVVP